MSDAPVTSPFDGEPAVGNPFPGLRPFEAEETHLFFGRDAQVLELLRRLRRTRFLAVVGSSGSGKSSLVRAGLLPALRGGLMVPPGSAWRIAVLRPGDDPMRRLADALVASGTRPPGTDDAELGRSVVETTLRRSSLGLVQVAREARLDGAEALLVLVDQFEEIFRVAQQIHRDGSGGAAAFVRLLLEAAAQPDLPIYVVLTMRSDYLGDCAAFRDLPEAINDGQYLIPRLTRDQLRDAIEGPIKVGEAEAAPRLIQRLLNDVGDSPDQLPILQHALMRTWDRWSRDGATGPLDLSHYEAIGTMTDALSRHAEEAWDELGGRGGSGTSRLQDIARQLFQRISEKGLDNRETRRPAPLRDVAAVAGAEEREVVAVVETFRTGGRTFLVPPAPEPLTRDSIIDISHEALLRLWGRLAGWVDEEARSAATYRRLAADAARYREGEVSLWRDPELTNGWKWRERTRPTAAWAGRYDPTFTEAMAFLDESRQAQRRAWWGRLGLWVAVPIALALIGLTGYSVRSQWQLASALILAGEQSALATKKAGEAQEQKRIAVEREKDADASAKAAKKAEGRAQDDRKLAEGLGREARARQLAAHGEVIKLEAPSRIERSALLAVESVRASHVPEGDRLLRELVGLLRPRVATFAVTGDRHFASLSPDGERIVVPRPDGVVVLIDAATGRPLADLDRGIFKNYSFSADSRRIALVEDSGRVSVWDASNGKFIASLPESTRASFTGFSDNGAVLLIVVFNEAILVWDPDRGGQPERFPVRQLDVNADGSLLSWWPGAESIHFRDRKTGNELPVLRQPGVTGMTLSPKGDLLAVFTRDKRVILVRPGQDVPIRQEQYPDVVKRVVWSPTGRKLAVVTGDRNNGTDVWMFPYPSGDGITRRLSVPQGINLEKWSPDEQLLAVAEVDNSQTREAVVRIWQVENGHERSRLVHQGAVSSVDFTASNDGRIATATTDGLVRVWQTGIGRELARLPHRTARVDWAVFSRGGERLVTSSGFGATVWDVVNQRGTVPLIRYDRSGPPGQPPRNVITPPGSILTQPRRLEPWLSERVVYSEGLTPDGARFVSAGGQEVSVWDAATGHSRSWPASVTPGDVAPVETVAGVAISANGKIAAAALGNAIQTWNVASGLALERFSAVERNRYRVPNLSVSDDGTRLAWRAHGGDRLFVSRPTAAPLMTLATAKDAPFALSPDGRRLAVMGSDFTLRIAAVAPGSVELPAGKGRLPEGPLVFSPDGRMVAWRSADTAVSIGRSGNDATRFETVEPATLLRFSGDGSLLVGVNRNGAVYLWAVNPPRLLTRLPPQPGTVRGAAVTPDNRTLVVAVDAFGGVGVVRHPLTAAGLVQQACALLQRNLSLDEWKEHMGAEPYRPTCPSLP